MKLLESSQHRSVGTTVFALLLAPLVGLIFLYANAFVTHLCAMLFGQNKKGFPATFVACAYAMAPAVLFAIPGCGQPVALVLDHRAHRHRAQARARDLAGRRHRGHARAVPCPLLPVVRPGHDPLLGGREHAERAGGIN